MYLTKENWVTVGWYKQVGGQHLTPHKYSYFVLNLLTLEVALFNTMGDIDTAYDLRIDQCRSHMKFKDHIVLRCQKYARQYPVIVFDKADKAYKIFDSLKRLTEAYDVQYHQINNSLKKKKVLPFEIIYNHARNVVEV